MQDAFQNAPRRLTRRCTSPAAANAAPYATRSPTSRSRPPPVIAATASIPAAARRPTRCCSRRDRSRCGAQEHRYRGGSGRAVMRSFCPDCGTPLFGGTEGANYDVVRAGSLDDPEAFRARVSLWTGSAPSAPHRCRRAQFSRQCATDSLRPTRYAAAKQKGESCRTRPFFMPHQDCHGGQSIFAWLTAPLAPACPRRTGRRSRSAAGP